MSRLYPEPSARVAVRLITGIGIIQNIKPEKPLPCRLSAPSLLEDEGCPYLIGRAVVWSTEYWIHPIGLLEGRDYL